MTGNLRNNAWIAVLVSGVLFAGLHLSDSDLISTGSYYAAGLVAVIAFVAATRINRRRSSRSWYFLSAGMALYFVGDVVWEILARTIGSGAFLTYTTAPFYLGAILFSSLAFLQWGSEVHTGNEREDTIDAAIVTLSFAILTWIFIIGPRLDDPMLNVGLDASALVFATLDLFPLALLVRMALRRGLRQYRALGLFIAGGMVIAVADSLYGWGELTGNIAAYETLADTGWLLWYILWAAAALDPTVAGIEQEEKASDRAANPSNRTRFAVLAAIALTAPLSIVFGALENRPLDTALVAAGTIALFALVIYRMSLVVTSLEASLATQERLQAELSHVAYHDALTGLFNRAFLNAHLEKLLRQRGEPDIAVLFLDLDNFKEINDRFGHAGGDRLLIDLARRLEACIRGADVVARLGGDEFLVILDLDGRDVDRASTATARRILQALILPTRLSGEEISVSASIGIAWPQAGDNSADSILGAADRAMYAAKRAGKNRYSVASELEEHSSEIPEILGEIPHEPLKRSA